MVYKYIKQNKKTYDSVVNVHVEGDNDDDDSVLGRGYAKQPQHTNIIIIIITIISTAFLDNTHLTTSHVDVVAVVLCCLCCCCVFCCCCCMMRLGRIVVVYYAANRFRIFLGVFSSFKCFVVYRRALSNGSALMAGCACRSRTHPFTSTWAPRANAPTGWT